MVSKGRTHRDCLLDIRLREAQLIEHADKHH
jgi:hypothetical protein